MPQRVDDMHLQRLTDEVSVLTKPRLLGEVIADTTGILLPGFSALPAVSILASESWKTRIQPEGERWRSGDIVALGAVEGSRAETKKDTAFFTPVGDSTIPLIDISSGKDSGRFEKALQLRPKERWEPTEIQFAFVPWHSGQDVSRWTSADFTRISKAMAWAARALKITLTANEESYGLAPAWGLKSWVPRRALDSIRFPINYAVSLVSPFIFRLPFGPVHRAPDGRAIELLGEAVNLKFEFPEDLLKDIYREAGLGQPDVHGFSIFGHAVPVMNVDLRAWLENDSYGEFARTAGARPMGVAGVYPYYKAGQHVTREVGSLEEEAHVFSLEIDAGKKALMTYSLPGETDTMEKKQLLVWMTQGSLLNGITYQYDGADIVLPLQKSSLLLKQARTVMPCFGGLDCHQPGDETATNRLFLNYSITSQSLLCRDSLLHTIRDLLGRLGHERIVVTGPFTELRVVDGVRRRVVVARVENRGGKPIDPGHVSMVEGYVQDRSPLGAEFVLEMT
jgi:hypothetical protein